MLAFLRNIFNSKITTYVLSIGIIVASVATAISWVPINQKKALLTTLAKQEGLDLQIKGSVYLVLLPTPHFSLTQVSIENHDRVVITADSLDVHLSLRGLFNNNFSFSSLALNNPMIYSDVLRGLLLKSHNNVQEITASSATGKSFLLRKGSLAGSVLENISGNISYDDSGIYGSLSFALADEMFNASINLHTDSENQRASQISAKSNKGFDMQIILQGNVAKEKTGWQGSIKAYLPDLHTVNNVLSSLSLDGHEYNFEDHDINLNGDFAYSQTLIKISNVALNSANLANAKGEMTVSLSELIDTDIKLTAEKINVPAFFANNEADNGFAISHDVIGSILTPPDILLTNISALIELKVGKIILPGRELSNFHINADAWSGNLYLNAMNFDLTPNTKFHLDGVLSHNKIRPKFSGKVHFNSTAPAEFDKWLATDQKQFAKLRQLNINSDLFMIPNKITFANINAAFGDVGINGDLFFLREPGNIIAINSFLSSDELDLDKFNASVYLDRVAYIFYSTDADKSGQTHFAAIDDYKWLRNFGLYFTLASEFDVKQLWYNGYPLKNVSLDTNIERGLLDIKQFKANSEFASWDGNIQLMLQSFRPVVNMDMHFANFDTKISAILPDYNILAATLFGDLQKQKHMAQKENETADTDPASVNITVPDFNFFSANNYDGTLKVNIDKLVTSTYQAENIKSQLDLANGNLVVRRLEGDAFNGHFHWIGTAIIMSPVPNFVAEFSFESINPEPIFAYITQLPDRVSGYMNIRGRLEGNGASWQEVISKIGGSADFIGKKIIWTGFDLGEIVQAPDIQNNIADKLTNLEYYSRNGSSFFNDVSGSLSIANGLVKIDNMQLGNNRVQGALSANYSLLGRTVSGIAQFAFLPIGQASRLTSEFKISGAIANPQVIVNNDTIINYMKATSANNEVNNRVDDNSDLYRYQN